MGRETHRGSIRGPLVKLEVTLVANVAATATLARTLHARSMMSTGTTDTVRFTST